MAGYRKVLVYRLSQFQGFGGPLLGLLNGIAHYVFNGGSLKQLASADILSLGFGSNGSNLDCSGRENF